MAARKTTPKTDAAEAVKPARKPREAKPVTDLATATVALKAAQRKADRTAKARSEAEAADGLAQTELGQAKAAVRRFYDELMGTPEPEDVSLVSTDGEDLTDAYAPQEPAE
jgi:membrane protein involved in colicin uptake